MAPPPKTGATATATRLHAFRGLLRIYTGSFRDLVPIIVVIGFFQIVVLQQPFPDLGRVLIGLVFVVVGLSLFVQGLEIGLFPLGESMAGAFARKGSLTALLAFAFCLGFGTTVAEPALIAVSAKAAEVAGQAGFILDEAQARAGYALQLRLTVALSVGASLVFGVFRILKGWSIHYLIIPGYLIVSGYLIVVIITGFAPPEIVGIAYDSGGVTTSTMTVPLVAAFGIGLATVIRGRNPLIDGFGLIAFASLMPIVFVLIYGMVV